jgi:hypothetical protein
MSVLRRRLPTRRAVRCERTVERIHRTHERLPVAGSHIARGRLPQTEFPPSLRAAATVANAPNFTGLLSPQGACKSMTAAALPGGKAPYRLAARAGTTQIRVKNQCVRYGAGTRPTSALFCCGRLAIGPRRADNSDPIYDMESTHHSRSEAGRQFRVNTRPQGLGRVLSTPVRIARRLSGMMMVTVPAFPRRCSRPHRVSARCGNFAALFYKSRFGTLDFAAGLNGFDRPILVISRSGLKRLRAVNGSV